MASRGLRLASSTFISGVHAPDLPMRFYAVRTEAIQRTFSALQQLGSHCHGPKTTSRAMRMATFYGHLQCHADVHGRLLI